MDKQYSTFNEEKGGYIPHLQQALEQTVTLNPEEMELLITATQQGDEVASRRLYDGFLLLLYDLSNEPIIRNKLKEDAFSIACEEFYKLVNSYKGPDFYLFPGLVRKVVRSRLFRAINKQEQQQAREISYEEELEKGQEIPQAKDEFERLVNCEEYREALQRLEPEAWLILYRYFYLEIPLKEQAAQAGVHVRTLQRQYHKALKVLREAKAEKPLKAIVQLPYPKK